ncbi:hypothetical protein H0O02_02120 [Candidatus Micrarchaeota archaeon]|nr:hypothetical protein [Candidatus Micrarchaeota archaeon]
MAEEKKVPKAEAAGETDPKLLALLAYIFSWLGGLVVFLISKDKFARFHAMQSLILGAITLVLMFIPILGWIIAPFVWLYGIYVGIVYAYKGHMYKIPYIGEYAEKYAG